MATWATLAAFTAGTAPSEADFDTVTGDIDFLGNLTSMGRTLKNLTSPDEIGIEVLGSASDSTDRSTTSTSFADMTGMSVTVTVNSGYVILLARGAFSHSAGSDAYITIAVDAVDEGGSSGLSRITVRNSSMLVYVKTGLSVASHTFKLRWKTTTGTLSANGSTDYPTSLVVLGG
jgi:hypothetical protein